ncbi:MAG: DUF4214 domain-containing protein [Candidatus Dormibacteraeota bacterium]|nr:DUF4214 domain-containing protein [Candidatus Dormibacteraeota bacterium]
MPDRNAIGGAVRQLRRGQTGDQLLSFVSRLRRRGRGGTERVRSLVDLRSDEAFLRDAYRLTLRREADPSGLSSYGALLRQGMSRNEVLVRLALSEESMNRVLAERFQIQNLRELRPESYETVHTLHGGEQTVFAAREAADFDWLERCILEYDYYEKPGIWTLGIDSDKRTMAEMLSCLHPRRVLEVGCSSGAVISGLLDRDIDAAGVEISAAAIRQAEARVRPRIYRGDLLGVDVGADYDLVFGLDIFEHFNPNRLDTYIARVTQLTQPGGFVFANVPTFGEDRVYGTIWEPHIPSWIDDIEANQPFHHLEVDDDGYPLHGHLVWAGSRWWEQLFTATGLRRETDIEQALHDGFDPVLRATPARRAFYVFSRDASRSRIDEIIDACRTRRNSPTLS